MLALADFADMLGALGAGLEQSAGRVGRSDDGRGMGFEQLEEIPLLGEQSLEPGKHRTHLGFFGDGAEHAGPARGLVEFARPEGADEIGQVGLLDRGGGGGQGEPAALALVLLFPLVELAVDGEREHLDVGHQRGAAALALAVAETAERNGADRADHAGFLERLLGGALMRLRAVRQIALGDDPAPGLSRLVTSSTDTGASRALPVER